MHQFDKENTLYAEKIYTKVTYIHIIQTYDDRWPGNTHRDSTWMFYGTFKGAIGNM